MDAENKDFVRRHEGSSEARIRANMHGTLTRKFVDLMAEYQVRTSVTDVTDVTDT